MTNLNNGLEAMWGGEVYDIRVAELSNRRIRNLLAMVVSSARMTKIAEPVIVRHRDGIEAVQLLAESHAIMTIQYWTGQDRPHRPTNAAWFTLFSCKPFDPAPITVILARYLGKRPGLRLTHEIQRTIAPPMVVDPELTAITHGMARNADLARLERHLESERDREAYRREMYGTFDEAGPSGG